MSIMLYLHVTLVHYIDGIMRMNPSEQMKVSTLDLLVKYLGVRIWDINPTEIQWLLDQ